MDSCEVFELSQVEPEKVRCIFVFPKMLEANNESFQFVGHFLVVHWFMAWN